MRYYDAMRGLNGIFPLGAAVIVGASLWFSHRLIDDLKAEEENKVGVWAEAMRSLTEADETTDLNLVLRVINGNHTIPVIVTDGNGAIKTTRNLNLHARSPQDSVAKQHRALAEMRDLHRPMRVRIGMAQGGSPKDNTLWVYYGASLLLQRLGWFPYVQLGVVSVFIVVVLLALLSTKRAEQNRVWVGLSKETAHQLGTPISSLMAWTAVLRETYPDDEMIGEMEADVRRLEMVADRFAKIGSAPVLKPEAIEPIVRSVADYIRRRVSKGIDIRVHLDDPDLRLPLSPPLVEWVVEVLCKNAVDAMPGQGSIDIHGFKAAGMYVLEVEDTGKGIARKDQKTVFRPGFTTKRRGWGLGLSLAKRIIEEYHHGRIFVLRSAPGEGTVFRIELPMISS